MINIDGLLRKNIRNLKPYSSARNEYKGNDAVFLDANENPFNNPYNRYPDPLHLKVRQKLASRKGVGIDNIFLGNGSDEAIDLLIRAFCEPGQDSILSVDPTYGMYKVCADINNIFYDEVKLTPEFQLDIPGLVDAFKSTSKLVFICSPNNPTGNSMRINDMMQLVDSFHGLVVIDEAYIDFSSQESMLKQVRANNNLVILQTFSKAWGLAGIRFGMAYAHKDIIDVLYKIKYPYNLNAVTQKIALEYLDKQEEKQKWVKEILMERQRLREELTGQPCVNEILPSDANFLMVRVDDAGKIYKHLINKKIIIRDRSKVTLCEGCLRITVGNKQENNAFLSAFKEVCEY
ncbi:MAG: histidinol-phosphate transaminase [Bacteroidota bacterium]